MPSSMLLAWTPFLDPLDVHTAWWFTLIPLALLISLAYKGVRLRTLDARIVKHTLIMTVQIVLAMIALTIASYLVVLVILPMFA